ncbi:MAG: isoleucine--tRNA ligase [Candidatus Omnitrophica bacterium]|nr:isoleucine--tRNA ligase [Candidatus Omnitrophota bacterium]
MSKKDYSNTLNLPKTSFSMKANLTVNEPKIISFWDEIGLYRKLRKAKDGKKKFILHDGPPYANGLIHIGHALNKILKDIVIKFKTMNDFDSPFICGWDCHGLPVEHQLFKELDLTKADVNVVDFRKKAEAYALKFMELQKSDFKRLGILSDWDNSYLTLLAEYEYWVIKLLGVLVEKGYIYRKRRPVNWCTTCETALAEAEVEYNDKESPSIYLLFKVKYSRGLFPEDTYFLIWTTTPWTLISNVAVAVHPHLDYILCNYKDKHIIFANNLKNNLESKLKTKFHEINYFSGKELEGIILSHPFMGRESKVVLAEFVSKDEGSGCVHIAPGHGEEDFSLLKIYDLDVIMPVNDKGIFDETSGEFAGKNIEQANQAVIETLEKKGLLLKNEKIYHSYPHCWRCKKPVIFRATFQWFLNIEHNNLRQRLLNIIEEVDWLPPSGKERIRGMLLLRPDWCLSRQRLWGVPIPALRCNNCKEIVLDAKVVEKTASVFRKYGSDVWFTLDVEHFLPIDFSCPKCSSKSFSKEFDILDVWFESGASFLAVVKNNRELDFPSDLYLEGSDQHRGWFQVSLINSVAYDDKAPFKVIVTHGFVVDGEGKKMSKSLGNVISPQEIIHKYGAEILRLWVAYSDYTEDVKISPQLLDQLVDVYRKIRNTIRFILGNLYDFDYQRDYLPKEELQEIDRYMLIKTSILYREIVDEYNKFSFHKVCQKLFNFCNLDLSSFYLDILKDRLYTYSPNSKERKSAQNVIYYILKAIIKLSAPILSFTAEEAFNNFFNWHDKKESIYLHTFEEDFLDDYFDEQLIEQGKKILDLREEVLKEIEKKREEHILGSSLEASVDIYFREKDYNFYKQKEDMLREVFIVSCVNVKEGDFKIEVNIAKSTKCARCWNRREDVGKDEDYPDLCGRCIKHLGGK